MEYRPMGNTGVRVSALGFGTMRLPEEDGKIRQDEAISMIRWAIDQGVNYVDTAYPYHGGQSEVLVGKALADGYREKVYLATKCPVWKIEKAEDLDAVLAEQMEKLQTDHIDFYLVHAINRERWEKTVVPSGMLDRLLEAKKDGRVRHIGFSFHDELPLFREIVDYWDQWDFCQIQLNYVDTQHQAGLEGLEYAAQKGLGVVIMEPLRGGYLANLPEKAAEIIHSTGKSPVELALDFLWDRPEVSLLLSGMSDMQQVKENVSFAQKAQPNMLLPEERNVLTQVESQLRAYEEIPCTGCNYCSVCPREIAIPHIIAAYNKCQVEMSLSEGKKAYREAAQFGALADACIGCGSCEVQCPQQIPISTWMRKIYGLLN